MPTALITHDVCAKHEMSSHHPECPERLAAITDQLKERDLYDHLEYIEAPKAARDHLVRAHGEEYVESLFAASPGDGVVQLDADTAMNPYSLDATLRASGAGILATDKVMAGELQSAFCSVRPPGHHAERTRAMGFCLFSSIAVAALYAVEVLGMERVAVVDFDVHHGNGTEDIVHDHPKILFCSSFQHPFYPGYFRPSVKDQLVNVPLPAGTGSEAFRDAITTQWMPALESYKPEMLFISAGFDAHRDDPLASLELNDVDFAWITTQLVDLADRHCGGRIVSMLEGGYNLDALGRSASEHVKVLLDV